MGWAGFPPSVQVSGDGFPPSVQVSGDGVALTSVGFVGFGVVVGVVVVGSI